MKLKRKQKTHDEKIKELAIKYKIAKQKRNERKIKYEIIKLRQKRKKKNSKKDDEIKHKI